MRGLIPISALLTLAACADLLGGLEEPVAQETPPIASDAAAPPAPDGGSCPPWLDGFGQRVSVAVQSKAAVADYSFPLAVDTEDLVARHLLRDDGSDLRVTATDGVTSLPFWIASGVGTHATQIWTKSNLAAGRNGFFVYYDAPQAVRRSDERATFLDGVIDNADFAAGTLPWFTRGPTGLGHATFDISGGAARIRLERDLDAGSVGATSAAWCQLVTFPEPAQELLFEVEGGATEGADVWIGGLATPPLERIGAVGARRDVAVGPIPAGPSSLCLGLTWKNAGGYLGDGEDAANELDVAFRNLRLRPHVVWRPVAGPPGPEERACGD